MTDKIYIGSGKEVETKFGPLQKLSFSKKDLETIIENLSEKGYVNLIQSKRKELGKYGENVYMTIDNWKPEAKQEQDDAPEFKTGSYGNARSKEEIVDISLIPF